MNLISLTTSTMLSHQHLLHFSILIFLLIVTAHHAGSATLLPEDEVEALQDIAKTLGKMDWNFSADPCSGESGWVTPNPRKNFNNSVTCSCPPNGTVCHVDGIVLMGQDLPGKLPSEIVRLPSLQILDLTNNYLEGSIPEEWGSAKLVSISISENRLSGSIPKALGNISTLNALAMECNQLSGVLPPELGSLTNLERFIISSNNFTGELPATLAQLTKLKDFWINDNQFTGQVPIFIQNWINVSRIFIQGSGLNGPIPTEIYALTNLTDLRISDLNGANMHFPPVGNMTKMNTLILRSCNIIGQLPEYLAEMTGLRVLDLSFNKLNGPIPSNFCNLKGVKYIYLTGNMLTGPVPEWMRREEIYIDISYNNFTTSTMTTSCEQNEHLNTFASFSMVNDSAGSVSCMSSLSSCQEHFYYLNINCGGQKVTIDSHTTYDSDTTSSGPSSFVIQGHWGLSTSGHFLDGDSAQDSYTVTNSSILSINSSQLYTEARISPISLTYYGFCMGNGNYTVNLHFAEIIFTNNSSYTSLGRRIFDIYVQGKLVWKDFNIVKEAGGVGKDFVTSFLAYITNNTLEIRLYWAGKGTAAIPTRGVYGPLISAISVNPNFRPPAKQKHKHNTTSTGKVVGIVAAATFVVGALIGILWWKGCIRPRAAFDKELKGLGDFSLRQIKSATNNFDISNKIGEGGFGSVYKGHLPSGIAIAVKKLCAKSNQGNREFVNEIGIISAQRHPNLVQLYGCCTEENQLFLIYEYLENNNLARALFGLEEHQLKLRWPTRQRICVGIARGIAYLHEESRVKIVHRDIKATNVLLDKDLSPKISDFGLARLTQEENTHISTRVAGTYGYMAPEYAMKGYCTDKVDVYSFGIVALEIVTGRINTTFRPNEQPLHLLDWARGLKEEGNLLGLVDPRLGSEYNKEEAMVMIKVALICTEASPKNRPSMSSVVSILEGQISVAELASDSNASFATEKAKLEEQKKYYQFIRDDSLQSNSISTIENCTASSSCGVDLYPLIKDSECWDSTN